MTAEETKVKEVEQSTDQVDIEKLIKWTDEECEEFDKEHHIHTREFRNLLKEARTLADNYNALTIQFEQLKNLLATGQMLGYTIECPKCKVVYNVKPDDMKYNEEIQCMDCGEKYIQNENIVGIYVREGNTNNDTDKK